MTGTTVADAALVARKDLRLELRTRVVVTQVLPFVGAVLVIFAFALDPDTGVLRRATSGLFWVTVLFTAVVMVQRSFAAERADGVLDALRLSSLRPAGIFLGKVAALTALLVAVEVLLLGGVVVLYGVTLRGYPLLVSVALAATVAIAAAGCLYGPLVAGSRLRDTALPLLLLPALAPVGLAAARGFEIALGRGIGNGWSWAGMLAAFATIYLVLGAVLWGPLLEDT